MWHLGRLIIDNLALQKILLVYLELTLGLKIQLRVVPGRDGHSCGQKTVSRDNKL